MKIVSIIIPCYNSANVIEDVISRIKCTINERHGYDYQIILSNDGSKDSTYSKIKRICEEDHRIIGLDLSKNYGQSIARMMAIKYVKGDILVFMDDDGQHSPEDIFRLIDKVEEGYDLVYAKFKNKRHNHFKKVVSKINSKVLSITTKRDSNITLSSYFAVSKFAIDCLKKYSSPFPQLGSYLLQVTSKLANVEIEHKERISGGSNYTIKKLFSLWLMGFTSFSIVPLRLSTILGFLMAVIGFLISIYLIILKIFNPEIAIGYTSTMSAILISAGIILLCIGMLGEYIGRIFLILSDMPMGEVRDKINVEVKNE